VRPRRARSHLLRPRPGRDSNRTQPTPPPLFARHAIVFFHKDEWGKKKVGRRLWSCDRSSPPPTKPQYFFSNVYGAGYQGAHQACGIGQVGVLREGMSWLRQPEGISTARTSATLLSTGGRRVRETVAVMDLALAVPGLRKAVHGLSALLPSRTSGMPGCLCGTRQKSI
jgi:hypothetical protein